MTEPETPFDAADNSFATAQEDLRSAMADLLARGVHAGTEMEEHVKIVADAVEQDDIATLRHYSGSDFPYRGLVERYLASLSQ